MLTKIFCEIDDFMREFEEIIDSIKIKVFHNKRIKKNRTFEGIAEVETWKNRLLPLVDKLLLCKRSVIEYEWITPLIMILWA